MADQETPEAQAEDVSELRKAADGAKAARREAELAKRELAFVKAGVNTDSKPAQALLNSYDGELSVEAIKAEAAEWGLVQGASEPEPEEPKSIITPEEQALQAMRDESQGAPAPHEPPQKSSLDKVLSAFEADRKEGYGQQEATNRAIGRHIQNAAAGDQSAIFNEEQWMERASRIGHGAQFAGRNKR